MLVPKFWAEASAKHRQRGKQVTVRRFGWSNDSADEAQRNAQQRADEALVRIVAGEKLLRREPKVPYNGAEGVPIREEVIERHGESVITRNIYGARCLNTPDVLFADIDFSTAPGLRFTLAVMLVLAVTAGLAGWWVRGGSLALLSGSMALLFGFSLARMLRAGYLRLTGGAEGQARRRVERFMAAHPDWQLRLYRSPAGFRALVLHRRFDPGEPAVNEFFRALGADPVYVQMCQRQQCFRARVSPKPWRIGIAAHIRPRPGVWPVQPEHMPARERWIEDYERRARDFASCRFVAAFGKGRVDRDADDVRALHDEFCRSDYDLPLA